MNSQVNMPAGIKTSYDDENRFQRRHFRNSMSSDIFFCAPENDKDNFKTPETDADQDNISIPAENDTQNGDEKESENAPSENFITPESNADEDNSCVIAESETNEKESEKEQFLEPSDNLVTPAEKADQDEDQVDSSEITESSVSVIETGNDDHKKTQRRHFYDKNASNIFFGDLKQ